MAAHAVLPHCQVSAQRLLDYLKTRPDVDAARVGVTGVSLGGMHLWLLAAVDHRVAAAAPMIGVQVRRPVPMYGDHNAGLTVPELMSLPWVVRHPRSLSSQSTQP